MVVDFANISSGILGGGMVLTLSGFIFMRLLRQIDILADKVEMINIATAKNSVRLDVIERYSDEGHSWRDRIVRIETHLKIGNH